MGRLLFSYAQGIAKSGRFVEHIAEDSTISVAASYAAKPYTRTMLTPSKDHRRVDLVSDVLPFGRLWYEKADDAIGYAMHCGRSHDAMIKVYDDAGNVMETHEHAGYFREP